MDSNELPTGFSGASRAPTLDEERDRLAPSIKAFRVQIDALIQQVPTHRWASTMDGAKTLAIGAHAPQANEAYDQVRINLTNAKMWAGKMLEGLGNPFPAELADKATLNPPTGTTGEANTQASA